MQVELGQVLRAQRDHASVMRSRRQLAEDHAIALHEELHAEDARTIGAGQSLHHRLGHALRRALHRGLHGAGHPRLLIVAAFLTMADRLHEQRAAALAAPLLHGEQRDLVVEVDELLHDHHASIAAHVGHGVLPGLGDVGLGAHHRLTLAAAAHGGLHHAGQAGAGLVQNGGLQRLGACGVGVASGGQTQFTRGQIANGVAVHGHVRGKGAGHHTEARLLQLQQLARADGLDLGHDEVRLVTLRHAANGRAVQHVDHLVRVGHLHGGRIGIAIHGHYAAPKPLGADREFLAKFTRAEQQNGGVHAGECIGVAHGPHPTLTPRTPRPPDPARGR